MGVLDRYRKTGGFYQLVSLVETCGPQKQEKFLELIRQESPAWADAIKTRMLDINRIYSWNNETLAEIIGTLQDLTVAIALHGANEELRARIYAMFTHARRRKIEDLFGTNKPSAGELAATHTKIIETVRKMAHDGYLRFEKIDPPLYIDDKIEEELNKAQDHAVTHATTTTSSNSDFKIEYDGAAPAEEKSEVVVEMSESRVAEISQLKKKIETLSKENAVLRHELSIARGKLDQIKKIA